MPRHYSAALPIAYVFMRVIIVLNWLSGAAILALLTATLVARDWTMAALGIEPSSGIPQMLAGLQMIAALGVIGVLCNDAILRRLLAMVETVRHGERAANEGRGDVHICPSPASRSR